MSNRSTRAQGTPTIPNVKVGQSFAVPVMYGRKNNSKKLNNFNHDWQVWSSRSVSPLSDVQTPNGTEPKRLFADTVIKVTDDGWRTVTQGSPPESHFDVSRSMVFPASLTHAPTSHSPYVEKPVAVLPTTWFSQPAPTANFAVHPDAAFQHFSPPGYEISIYPPFPSTAPQSRPQEFYQAPPSYIGIPVENQGPIPVPFRMRPSQFPAMPGTIYSKPPPDPFTDHSFGFDPSRNHFMPQYPIAPNQIMSPPTYIYPNSIHMPGVHDSRIMHLAFDYAPPQPQYYFPSPPQLQFPPPNGPPISPVQQLHGMGNNFVSDGFRELPFANSYSNGLSPSRHSRHSWNLPARQPRTSSSSSPHGGSRSGRRANHTGLPRSSLMEEFRSNRDKHWTLQDIFGHIVEFSGDQNGSRFIQQQLEEASEDDKQRVFDEIVPSNASRLIQDVFGNYVVQKFFDLGTVFQKEAISLEIENDVINYSVHIYACRVVQKAFDYMSEEQQNRIIDRLAGNLLTCIKDQHGNHVIQKLIDTVTAERLTFLRIVSLNIPDLAASSTGCRVLQRCLSKLPKAQINPVLDAIDRHCDTLMRDQYGNYVIQFILQHGDDADKARILAKIRGSVVKLSKNQYASHVCEKAIAHTDAETRSLLLGEILTDVEGGHPILDMMQDDFANYVLQRALALAEGEQRVVLFHQVKSFLTALRRSTQSHSKQLVKIERLVDRYFGKVDRSPQEDDVE